MSSQRITERLLSQASSLKQKKFRDSEGLFLLEGDRLVHDALRHRASISYGIVRVGREERFAELIATCGEQGVPVYVASERQFARITDTRQAQGIAVVASLPAVLDEHAAAGVADGIPIVALHSVADPGNLGTIIRAMDWFGAPLLLLSSGSVDPWSPKVVRSAMGSIFRVSVLRFESDEHLLRIAATARSSIIAAVAESGVRLPDLCWPGRPLLLFGSEAHGLPHDLADAAAQRATIPGGGKAESLNLAMSAAIMLYALSGSGRRQ
jgi:RNA methyltransferase, TrmH family